METITLNEQQLRNLFVLMNRVQLQGNEVPVFNDLMRVFAVALQNIEKEKKDEVVSTESVDPEVVDTKTTEQ